MTPHSDPNAEPAWTCASADTMVASASASGCSATGIGIGTTTIAATITRGTAQSAGIRG